MSRGHNKHGQLGQGDTKDKLQFEEIKGLPRNIAEVVCGYKHTFILCSDGKLLSCGNNINGQLGHGDTKNRSTFEYVRGIPANISEIACNDNTFIRLTNGRILSCGLDNGKNKLFFGDIKISPKPSPKPSPKQWVDIIICFVIILLLYFKVEINTRNDMLYTKC